MSEKAAGGLPPDVLRSTDPVNPAGQPSPDQETTLSAPFTTLAVGARENRFRAEQLSRGERIGHYEILNLLGEGGFSAVYAARHLYLNHEVALKTLRRGATGREDSERFLREAQALAILASPHVIRVHDAGMWNDLPYIVLEKITGDNVQDLVARRGPFSLGRAMDLLEELGRVLVLQEQRGILHRDIKPSNVLQRTDGSFCLADYGLVGRADATQRAAREALEKWDDVTLSGQFFGTPLYIAPEQIEGRADHRTDLFLLGMTAWECLAGKPARMHLTGYGSDLTTLFALARQPLPTARSVRDDVPEGLDAVLSGLLAPAPEERYHSAAEFVQDLEAFRYQGRPPQGSTRGDVFVAMPFAPGFGAPYEAIEQACVRVRLRPRRMDQLVFVKDIWNQIVQEIEACAMVVADFSAAEREAWPNPNVLTEAAHARAINKALIILSQDPPERLPFDWRHIPVLRYTPDPAGLQGLTEQLTTKLRHAMLATVH